LGVEDRIELQMGTLGKALGVGGGYVACSTAVRDLLVNRARSFIFSTAPPPAMAWAAKKAVEVVRGAKGDALRARLRSNADTLGNLLAAEGYDRLKPSLQHLRRPSLVVGVKALADHRAAIFPLVIGDETVALHASEALLDAGILIPAIRYPTVARGTARLRLTLSAAHEPVQIERLVACLHGRVPQLFAAAEPSA
jgi:7-keto-8-aminopelargonate synthetase-like enzyme